MGLQPHNPEETAVDVEIDCPDCNGDGTVPTQSGYQRRDCYTCLGRGVLDVPADELV
jgi:DnaJ-class molecular chaperone